MEKIELICIASSVAIITFNFFYLTLNHQIFGIDAWYWLKFGFQKPLYQNIIMLLMWLSVFIIFKFSGRENPYFFASLFLLLPFNIRLLEVELDDYLYYLFSFLLIAFFKKHGKAIAIAIIILYLTFHSFFLFSDFVHKESTYNLLSLVFTIPFFFIILENKKYKEFLFILSLCLIFSFGKFIGSALPIYAFAFFISENIKINKKFLTFFLIFSLVFYTTSVVNLVESNKVAFEKYCNKETKICNNYEEPHYGHYFAYLGYISNNSYEFGVCTCVGKECLNKTIKC